MVSFKWWHFGRGATQHFIIYDGGLNFVDVKAAPDRARRLIKVKTCDRNACAAIEWPTTWMETRNVQGRGHGLLGAARANARARVSKLRKGQLFTRPLQDRRVSLSCLRLHLAPHPTVCFEQDNPHGPRSLAHKQLETLSQGWPVECSFSEAGPLSQTARRGASGTGAHARQRPVAPHAPSFCRIARDEAHTGQTVTAGPTLLQRTGDVAVSTAAPLQGLTRRWRGVPACG